MARDHPEVPGGKAYWLAQNGGNGSFSYADTARHGVKDYRETGALGGLVVPGHGGGGRLLDGRRYGGRNPLYIPPLGQGVVLIRLTKIE